MLVRRARCEGGEKIIGRGKRGAEFEGIIGAGGFVEGCMYVCIEGRRRLVARQR